MGATDARPKVSLMTLEFLYRKFVWRHLPGASLLVTWRVRFHALCRMYSVDLQTSIFLFVFTGA